MFIHLVLLTINVFIIFAENLNEPVGKNLKNTNENPFENTNFWIERINNDPNSTWKAGQNFDLGLPSFYVRKLVGTFPVKDSVGLPYRSISDADLEKIKKELPICFDGRKAWSYCQGLQKIVDQGDCGSCWAVAATSVLTDRFCIKTQGKFNKTLSAEDLLSCCKMCGAGCDGGYVDNAWLYLKNVGIVTGGDYSSHEGCVPYSKHPCSHYGPGHFPKCSGHEPIITPECKQQCSNPNYKIPYEKDRKKASSSYKIEPEVTKIQAELLNHGPIEAVFDVFEDFLAYKSGIYKRTIIDENKFIGLHAVKLIGWGVDNKTSLPYWLVQNSWNNDWGDKGFFKILRGVNECNFEIDLYAGIP